jgi:hypothetical protein
MTYQQRLQLASSAKVSLGTVNKWLKNGTVTAANNDALTRAMTQLGLACDNEDPEIEKAAP